MTEITCRDVTFDGIKIDDTYITTAGAIALAQPFASKEYVYNEDRSTAGKQYLLGALQPDDVQVSVQFCSVSHSAASAMAAITSAFGGGKVVIESDDVVGTFLYRSISNIQSYAGGQIVLFNLNLIKLAG